VVSVVTVNDTDAAVRANASGADGSGSFGRFWRVNGAAFYVRGANKVSIAFWGVAVALNCTTFVSFVSTPTLPPPSP
jgi:hypothetical protein